MEANRSVSSNNEDVQRTSHGAISALVDDSEIGLSVPFGDEESDEVAQTHHRVCHPNTRRPDQKQNKDAPPARPPPTPSKRDARDMSSRLRKLLRYDQDSMI